MIGDFERQLRMSKLCPTITKHWIMGSLFKKLNSKAVEEAGRGNMLDDSHFYDFQENIYGKVMSDRFKQMFINGNGDELRCKAAAVHSSSMLAYNFFHWINEETPLSLNGVTYTKVYFEVHLPVLRGTAPSNMDVILEGTDATGKRVLLFIESKFTEYFSNSGTATLKKMTKNSYTRPEKYFVDESNAKKWINLINGTLEDCTKAGTGYFDGIKQEICHLIALFNLKNSSYARECYTKDVDQPEINGSEKFIYYNLLYRPSKKFEEESKLFDNYCGLFEGLKNRLDNNGLSPSFEMDLKSYGALWPDVKESIEDPELVRYLTSCYMGFEAATDNK